MAWEKKAGKKISKKDAMEMIESFHKGNKNHIRSIYYDKEQLQSLINTPGCAGVSIHFAQDGTGAPTLVLLPVNEEGAAIFFDDDQNARAGSGFTALDTGASCPPYCPK